jgi:hypothetical protein
VALFLFAFVVHQLVIELGMANWASLGVGALFVAIIGSIWLIGNSLLDIIARAGSRRYANYSTSEQTHPDHFALAGHGSGHWIAVLFVWRVTPYPAFNRGGCGFPI